MAFTVKGEYERLLNYQLNSFDGKLPFEYGCACGYVTRIEYLPNRIECNHWLDEEIRIYAIAGFDDFEKLVLVINKDDVSKRYQDRRYKYWREFNVLESFMK